jgi:uncharacterized membrane protein
MRGYRAIDPSFPERIFSLTEEEAEHRRALEPAWLEAEIEDQRSSRIERARGQTAAAALSLLLIAVGTAVTMFGHDWVGGIVLGSTLTSLVIVFVTGRAIRRDAGRDRIAATAGHGDR